MGCKGPWTNQNNFQKEQRVRGLTLSDFKIYYKATVTKILGYWCQDRQRFTEQKRKLETDLHIWTFFYKYGQFGVERTVFFKK